MKNKVLLTLAVLLSLAGASHAQTTPAKGAVGSNPTATAMTREMSTRLQLNEGQYIKLYSINRTRMERQQEIERSTDAATRAAQLAELQAQYEQECARILTPSQLSLLQQEPAQLMVSGGRG